MRGFKLSFHSVGNECRDPPWLHALTASNCDAPLAKFSVCAYYDLFCAWPIRVLNDLGCDAIACQTHLDSWVYFCSCLYLSIFVLQQYYIPTLFSSAPGWVEAEAFGVVMVLYYGVYV